MGVNKITHFDVVRRKKTFNVLQVDVANIDYVDELDPIRGPLNLE